MLNFSIQTSTEVVFGKDIEDQIGHKLKEIGATHVLVHFGGNSARASGLLSKVENSLSNAGLSFTEFGGVSPNPKLSLVRQGIELCKRENIDFILAVGGGSVIDSAKGIALGAANKQDPWDFVTGDAIPTKVIPLGTVLTLSASGSETSTSCVLTNEETKQKKGITSQLNRPRISFLNPENTYSVSKFQTGCGIVDIMMHTLERHLTPIGGESDITDRLAEAVLLSTIDAGRRAIANQNDYEARATLMWAGSISHNDLTGCGRERQFPVHKLEHELSALHDEIAHGAGLSVLFPAWALFVMKHDIARFAQIASRVFGIQMDFACPERTAKEGILALKRFFKEIDMPVRLSEIGIHPSDYNTLAENAINTTGGSIKSYIPLGKEEILSIFRLAE